MAKTELFGRWLQGSVVVEDQGKSTGRRFFVRSGIGVNGTGYGLTPDAPFATLAYAVTQCTASRHDIIYVLPGHTENITATITPLAGTRIVGLGTGNLMPQLTPAADNLLGFTISAANVTVENIYFNDASAATCTCLFAVTGRHFHLRGCHMDMGANDRIGIRMGNGACYAVIENNVVQVVDNGPDSWITFVHANIDLPLIRHNSVIASDGADPFDDHIIDFGGLAVRNPVIVHNVFDGAGVAVNSIDDAGAVVGDCFSANMNAGAAVSGDTVAAFTATIGAGAITAASFGAGAIDAAAIAANAIGNAEIAAGAISAAKFAAGAVDAAAVATGAVDADAIAADTILGADNNNNAFESTNVVSNRDGSIIERLEAIDQEASALNAQSRRYLAVTADFSAVDWNTQATHEVFAVTGCVRMRMWITCTGDVDSAAHGATLQFGVEGATNAFIAATDETELDSGDLWYDATPTTAHDTFGNAVMDRVVNLLDVGYEISNEALTQGSLVFHCVWEPLNAAGLVAASTGIAL